MEINFAVIITLPGDYGADADFGLVVEGGLSKFKWSVGTATGYATGFLVDEWCSEMTNSVDPEGGGGVAQIGGFTITAANGTQLYKLLDTLPIQKALIEVRELPSLAVAKGRIDYYNWDDRRVDFFVESLDASADVSLSGIVDDKVIPMQLGSLRYAEGVRTTSKSDVLEVPGLGHAGRSFPIFVMGADSVVISMATSPTDWAGAIAFLNSKIPGLVCSLEGQLRKVTAIENPRIISGVYSADVVSDRSFIFDELGQFFQKPLSFIDYSQRYEFDTWDLNLTGNISFAQDGEVVKFGGGSFEFDSRGVSIIPSASLPDGKVLAIDYRLSYRDLSLFPSVTRSAGNQGARWVFIKNGDLSDGNISNDYQTGYIYEPIGFAFVLNAASAGGRLLGVTSTNPSPVDIPTGSTIRLPDSNPGKTYIVTAGATAFTGFTTISISYGLDNDVLGGELLQVGTHILCSIIPQDVYTTEKGTPYIAMDVEDIADSGSEAYLDIHIAGELWDGSLTSLGNSVPQINPDADVSLVANLTEDLGGDNSPISYPNPNEQTDQIWQNGNGWKQTQTSGSGFESLNQFTKINIYVIKYPTGFAATSTVYIREMGFGLASETSLPDRIYCELEGRGVGLGAKTGWTAAMQTPNQFAQHIRQLTNNGGTPPDAGWGQNYGFGSTLAFRVIRAGEGGFNDSDILQFGFSTNAAGASIPEAGALDAMRSLFRENFVINWIDSNGLPAVAQLVRAYSRPITKTITLKEIIPGTISVDEMQASEIYCNPVIKWGELPNGEYEGTLSITGSELALATEAEQAARVQGSSLDQAGRALLWQRARALYLKYGNVAPMPEELSFLQWCKSAAVADWHLQNLLSWYGVNDSAVVSPRRFFRFTVPYEVAQDDLLYRFDVGSRFILNLPHQTDGANYECICLNVSHDLVGLQTTLYAVGFKSADWPTPVVTPDYIQDQFFDPTIWEDQYTDTDIKEDSWP